MSCFITLEQDLKELTHYDNIKNGIEHLYEEKMLEVILEDVGQKVEFQPEKSKRGFDSVRAV